MNTDSDTWPVCRGARHLTQADVDSLMARVSADCPSAEQRKLLDQVTDTLRKAMDRRDSEPGPSRPVLAAVAGEWSLLRTIAHGIAGRLDDEHVTWANPFVYFGPYPQGNLSWEEQRARGAHDRAPDRDTSGPWW